MLCMKGDLSGTLFNCLNYNLSTLIWMFTFDLYLQYSIYVLN